MKYLITGVHGQLGQDFRKLLQDNSVDHISTGSQDLDISDLQSVTQFILTNPVDVIINCAAYNAVDLAETQWQKAFAVNGLGVRNLALAAKRTNALLVHFSSDYIFDGDIKRPYTIADHPRPICRYGESKLLGEQFIRDIYNRFFLIRTSWVFGKGNDNFVKKVIAWSKNQNEIKVVDDQIASPTYTADLAQVTLDLVKSEVYGIYHVTNSGYCSRYEWAEHILQQLGWQGNLIPAKSCDFNTPAQRPPFSVLDNFGTPETLGYSLPDWQDATTRFLKELEITQSIKN